MIRQKYPAVSIEGENYPPPPIRATIAQVLSSAKFLFIALVLFGYDPFPAMGMQTPSIFAWAFQNKAYACMMLFFLSNAIEGQMVSTGAFEISLNDVPVWSKLETGRVPSPPELFQILDSQMRLSHGSTSAEAFH